MPPTLFTYGPDNVDELLTTTLTNMRPGIRDNIFKSNPIFDWLHKKNKITLRGGASISHGLLFESNSGFRSYQQYDILDTTAQDGMTRDQWDWAQYSVPISIDGFTERVANAGEQQIIDILAAKRMQAEATMAEGLEIDLFAASPGSKDIRSLATIVDSTGTEGDINGTTNTWWASNETSSGSFASQGLKDMTSLYNDIAQEGPVGPPEFIITTQAVFQFYETALEDQKRYTNTMAGDGGFVNLTFKAVPMTFSPQATSGVLYMLTSKALHWYVHDKTDFAVRPFVTPSNQDARVSHILLACALTTSNRRKLGKLTGITA